LHTVFQLAATPFPSENTRRPSLSLHRLSRFASHGATFRPTHIGLAGALSDVLHTGYLTPSLTRAGSFLS